MGIRSGKTLLAALLLFTGIREARVSWMYGSRLSVFVGMTVILALCGLLLHSAYLKPLDERFSSRGWHVFWTIVGVLSAMSILGGLLGTGHRPH